MRVFLAMATILVTALMATGGLWAAAPEAIEGAAKPPAVYTPPGLPQGSKEPDVPRGILAYGNGEYALAYNLWLPLAKAGNPSAQYHIGNLFFFGKGREKNLAIAAKWFEKAALQGHALAQHNLAQAMLESGGSLGDAQLAYSWSLKSAYQGFPNAAVAVGGSLIFGDGVDKNIQAGFEWLYWALRSKDTQAVIGLAGAWLSLENPFTTNDIERGLYFLYRAELMGEKRFQEELPEIEYYVGVEKADEILRIAKEDAQSGSLSPAFQLPSD